VEYQQPHELESLLCDLFADHELRQFVHCLPEGEDIAAEIPGPGVPLKHLVHETVQVLDRRGRIDEYLFQRLSESRPGRHDEIAKLAERMPDASQEMAVASEQADEWLGMLPVPLHGRLVGRQQELDRLDAAWDDPGTRVLSIVAWGGAGKSTLVHHWLERMRQDDWRGARKIYGWSFYAQGTDATTASAEAFFADALKFFGVPAGDGDTLQTRVRKLVTHIRKQRALLVLDGLEPLQEPPHDLEPGGKLRDANLSMLLRELARDMEGLCLITSRLAVKDLARQRAAPVLELDRLSTADGVALLRDLGVRGCEAELRATVDEQDGHALALMLLGTYLHAVRGGDIGRRHDVCIRDAAEAVDSESLERIVTAYSAWLEPRSRAVMRMVGLFDRPADEAALAALRRPPAIPGLTDVLADASDDDWHIALRPLRETGLLAPASPQQPGALDAHPLVRACVRERLRREPETWRAAHARLYEHYLAAAAEQPTELAELGRLVDAMIHGCHAGRHAEVYREVYRGRIHARDGYRWVPRLGAFGLELSALAAFFERRWDRPVATLESAAQADVLEVAGYDLLALGRLTEARVPTRLALELDQAAGRWDPASVDASLLAEIELLLGELDAAQEHARIAVALAERGQAPFARRLTTRTLLGEVLLCAGALDESQAIFDEAEALLRQEPLDPTLLVGLPGARHGELLLDRALPLDGSALDVPSLAQQSLAEAQQRLVDVRRRAELMIQRAEACEHSRYTLARQRKVLGRAHLGLWLAARARGMPAEAPDVVAHRNQATAALDLAVDDLRQSGRDDALPRALLARAGLRRFLDDPAGAEIDLAEAEDVAGRSGMRLLGCDAHLERARLSLAAGDAAAARAHTDAAAALVAETGYHRRDRELAALDAALSRTG
jgi:tetratricopeptide (TPR) repeat protein